ncbi:hypothetical protein Hamer_G018121 [Homarus americanus]|uniref:Uncharacterized protein n=1 Tax=Homarus americanus TaxID=6706 RepID=A0A8J5N655_HOMAM|nr:hypothetical protein Hamer_G018121 [Homarus americanus]
MTQNVEALRCWNAQGNSLGDRVTTSSKENSQGSQDLCSAIKDTSGLAPCDHGEAETRMILHVANAVNEGFQKILVLVILAVAAAAKIDIQELLPAQITNEDFVVLERFTILLYDRTSTMMNIDEEDTDAISSTRASLVQHTKRAVHQGGHCWGNVLKSCH